MAKPEIKHYDKLGNEITLNSVVAVPNYNNLMIAKVIKLNRVMVKIKEYKKESLYSREYNKYPVDCIVISNADAVAYILKNT